MNMEDLEEEGYNYYCKLRETIDRKILDVYDIGIVLMTFLDVIEEQKQSRRVSNLCNKIRKRL